MVGPNHAQVHDRGISRNAIKGVKLGHNRVIQDKVGSIMETPQPDDDPKKSNFILWVILIGIIGSGILMVFAVDRWHWTFGPITYGEYRSGKSPTVISKEICTFTFFSGIYFSIVALLAWLNGPSIQAAALEKLRVADRAELDAQRATIREDVENDWQKSKQAEVAQQAAELEAERNAWLSILDRNRQLQADYEQAVKNQQTRTGQLENFVIAAFPDFAQRFDPAGRTEPAEVARAFRDELAAKLPDLGLLRRTINPHVQGHLGNLSLLPLAPPVPAPPVLLPLPEKMRQKFGTK